MSITTLDGSLHRGCGGRYALQTETVTMRISGMAAEVTREFYRCAKCGQENRTIDQRDVAEKSATEQIRVAHDLLAPKAIRQLRESLGLTIPSAQRSTTGSPFAFVSAFRAAWVTVAAARVSLALARNASRTTATARSSRRRA